MNPKEDETNVPTTQIKSATGDSEPKKELTEEEKREKFIEAIKQSHIRYHPKKQFGVAYKQKRKAKNKMQRESRKLARKK